MHDYSHSHIFIELNDDLLEGQVEVLNLRDSIILDFLDILNGVEERINEGFLVGEDVEDKLE